MNYISEMEINVKMQSTENLSKLEQEHKDLNRIIYNYPKERSDLHFVKRVYSQLYNPNHSAFPLQKREDIEQKLNSNNV